MMAQINPKKSFSKYLIILGIAASFLSAAPALPETEKPVLHGRHWVAITGKPLAATAGAKIFDRGGNAVDAACAMLAATCTMFDVLSWGGETQALIYDPVKKKVIAVNALGVAPTGATPEFYIKKGFKYPPADGPLSAVTPGTPGGLMVMLAEFGTMSLKEVLEPAIEMADGYPVEQDFSRRVEQTKEKIKQWPYSRHLLLPHLGQEREAPQPGEILKQPDLARTLRKLVASEQNALKNGKTRREAIYEAYNRFYRGDIAREFVRSCQEQGGLITLKDLDGWQVYLEKPVKTVYKGIVVYKLTSWVQGPVMLQALNMLENLDLKSMGYNSTRYIHTLYQVMNMVYADRDFYYGDPYFPPKEPIKGLLSKKYAKHRLGLINWQKNDPAVKPGDPYPFQGEKNPYLHLLKEWTNVDAKGVAALSPKEMASEMDSFTWGTTSIQAADKKGWIVSVTPSGGWIPVCIAGKTGVGMSQRAQSFVLDKKQNPYNVIAPGKRPRATLTPGLAIREGKPLLSFAVQGGDTQDQNLLQFFLNFVEFGMNIQEACEAANITSYQMCSSFGKHVAAPGRLTLHNSVPPWVRHQLQRMGYKLGFRSKTSGPINAIFFDWKNKTFWGGSSNYGDDYGIAW
jgi:gamma-glutamyltranspeptidase/glutathione hydrolase